MIRVENLTKYYGANKAVDDASFHVEKGSIVAFLGRNGAGKTTTMRILVGSLGATQGRALGGGFDIFKEPRKVKEIIGYLPENPPLYTDMTVRSYLRFCARIKQADRPKGAVEEAIEQVGLKEWAHRLIGHLSKGYRQRVGIAQALVHKPKVLVLDEPGSGLDPGQWAEIRDLIKTLAEGDTTVLLSSHVLAQVSEICSEVVIISNGQIVRQGNIEKLMAEFAASQGSSIVIRVARPTEALLQSYQQLKQVTQAEEKEEGCYHIEASTDIREDLARMSVDAGLLELSGTQRLEDMFLRLTDRTAGNRATVETQA